MSEVTQATVHDAGSGGGPIGTRGGDARTERVNWNVGVKVRKFADDDAFQLDYPYEVLEREGNLLLNEGIAELLDLLIAAGSGEVAYNNANARIGVGNGTTAADASQTGLQGASTAFKGMDATYPSRSGQTVSWRATFGSGEANFAWEEWTIDNGSARNRNLNRKVESLGTKVSGTTWQITVQISIA